MGLERRLSSVECFTLLQRTQVQLPEPNLDSLQSPMKLVPGVLMSVTLQEHLHACVPMSI